MKFKAVIFDLDGTLLNSLGDIAGACNLVLRAQGLPVHQLSDYQQWVGAGMKHLLSMAVAGREDGAALVESLLPQLRQTYHENCTDQSSLYPGIREMLTELEAMGIQKSILSNKPHEITKVCVGHFLHNFRFEPVLGQKEGVPAKPDPGSALKIAQVLQRKPTEILYIGDTAIDMHTAQKAGFYPLGVAWGFRPGELKNAGALTIGNNPGDILELLRGNP